MSEPQDQKPGIEDKDFWGNPYFIIGVVFLIIGISTPTFLAIGVIFIALSFSGWDQDEKKPSGSSPKDPEDSGDSQKPPAP